MKRTAAAATAAAALTTGIVVGQLVPLSAASSAETRVVQAAPAAATPGTVSVPAAAAKPSRVLTLAAAQRLATAALAACAGRGYQVTVSVVDRDGIEIATGRDEDATGATVAVATAKAVAAVGFRSPTAGLQEAARTSPGFINVPGFVILPGGQPISVGDELVGGIGVSGAPTGEIDDACIDDGERATS